MSGAQWGHRPAPWLYRRLASVAESLGGRTLAGRSAALGSQLGQETAHGAAPASCRGSFGAARSKGGCVFPEPPSVCWPGARPPPAGVGEKVHRRADTTLLQPRARGSPDGRSEVGGDRSGAEGRAAWLEPGGCGAGVVIVPVPQKTPLRPTNKLRCRSVCAGKSLTSAMSRGPGSLEAPLQGGRTRDRRVGQEAAAVSGERQQRRKTRWRPREVMLKINFFSKEALKIVSF